MHIESVLADLQSMIDTVDEWGFDALREAEAHEGAPELVRKAKRFGTARRNLLKAREALLQASGNPTDSFDE